MSKVLIIDDSDPAITYTGNWASVSIVGVLTGEYNVSTHQSSAAGDRLSYTFEGTGIAVYGTLETPGQVGAPVGTFSIDGQTPTAFNSTGDVFVDFPNVVTSYVPLYQSPRLTKGTHTLTISSGTPPSASARLNIDFLTVATGSDVASGNIIVDDRDDAIQYSGNWANAGTRWEYGLTSKGSPEVPGTAITVYGTTTFSRGPNATAAVSFTLDGGFTSTYDAPQNSGLTQHYPMFQAKGLSGNKEHTIVITSLNQNRWFLDCIVYTTQNSGVLGGGGGSGSASVSDPTPGPVAEGGSLKPGAVVGGVIGGVAAGLLIAAIIFFLFRWRKQKGSEEVKSDKQTVETRSIIGATFVPFTSPGTGTPPTVSPNKRYDSNGQSSSNPLLMSAASAERVGRVLLESTPSTSYLGTHSPSSSVPPAMSMSQYSDGESHHIISPAPGPSNRNAHQNFHSQPYPRFEPGPGGGVSAMYQRDSGLDYDRPSQHAGGQKALYSHGLPVAAPAPVVSRPPPSTVRTVEEDSGIRIPARSPPVYTAD